MNISANLLLSGKADATNRKGAHTPPLERNMDYMKKILVLEDEPSIRSFVVINLRRSGYEPIEAATGEEALEKLKQNPDTLVALLDVMLPEIDGIELLRRMKADAALRDIPVIMATAKGAEYDKILGLDLGADDYLTKPFGVMELVSRVKAVLRRCRPQPVAVLRCGGLVVDEQEHTVTADGVRVVLTYKEYQLLRLFLSHPGTAFTRDQLMEQVWGMDFYGESRTVDMHIRTLRQKLGVYGEHIETVRSVGYRWRAQP